MHKLADKQFRRSPKAETQGVPGTAWLDCARRAADPKFAPTRMFDPLSATP